MISTVEKRILTVVFVALALSVAGYFAYTMRLRAIEPITNATSTSTTVSQDIEQAIATKVAEAYAESNSPEKISFSANSASCPAGNGNVDNIVPNLNDILGQIGASLASECVKVDINVRWSVRLYQMESPERNFIKVKLSGTITVSYLDENCKVVALPPENFSGIELNFELVKGKPVPIIDIPPGTRQCPIVFSGWKKFTFGSVDPDKCERCKKPVPVPVETETTVN